MKTHSNHMSREHSQPACHSRDNPAFTLIELLVIVGILAMLATMTLPAICKAGSQSKTVACATNFRQWAVSANLYAQDNMNWLPSANPNGGGMLAWDVGTNLCDALGPYGVDVPKWFCPVRPHELSAANETFSEQMGFNHPIQNVADLRRYLSRNYPQELVMNHTYWVPRSQGTTSFPTDYSRYDPIVWPEYIRNAQPESAVYGWPKKTSDKSAALVPFVSDRCASGNIIGLNSPGPGSPDVAIISPNTAHFVNGRLKGVNIAFADGRVESHGPAKLRPVYAVQGIYWFY